MNDPLVSIAINNFNYGRFVGEAIESARAQPYPHIEVIVVDDDEWVATSDPSLLPGRTLVPFLVREGIYWRPPERRHEHLVSFSAR